MYNAVHVVAPGPATEPSSRLPAPAGTTRASRVTDAMARPPASARAGTRHRWLRAPGPGLVLLCLVAVPRYRYAAVLYALSALVFSLSAHVSSRFYYFRALAFGRLIWAHPTWPENIDDWSRFWARPAR